MQWADLFMRTHSLKVAFFINSTEKSGLYIVVVDDGIRDGTHYTYYEVKRFFKTIFFDFAILRNVH
jgi:hypothetical protein